MMDVSESPETRPCQSCGQLMGVRAYDDALWDLYSRRADGRQHGEALVFTGDDGPDWGDPDENFEVMQITMERNMVSRGLCPTCGRPRLDGFNEEDFLSEQDAREQADMYAEQRAERRAGC